MNLKRILHIALCLSVLLTTADLPAQTEVLMTNGRVRICKGIFKDSEKGKTKGDYDHNENYTLTLSVPGAKSITLKFKSFCTEKDNDVLRIFDGKDTFSTLMGTWSGTKGPGTITSTDSFITIHFRSDKSVACTGWEADIITVIVPPVAPRFTLNATAKCNDLQFTINSDRKIPCDSLKVSNCTFTGPQSIGISSISATNCSGGTATQFRVNLSAPLNLNGTYTLNAAIYWKDFCDSVYVTTTRVTVSVADCPLKVVLKADADTICKGSCTWLRATVAGGTPSRYVYTWTPTGLSGAGPIRVCPTAGTRYILRVTDGISIPSSDTVDMVVLDPPSAMKDTEVCYYSGNFMLRATPAGGKWFGKGIVNSSTGEFKPNGNYGINKVWYQIGSCADTVLVNSTLPWNLENVFCPGTAPRAVWWYGPAGGTWSGPKITPAGIFNPDVPGIYKDTYTWKGCISVKTIRVEQMVVPPYDTVCESVTFDTLKFSPYGIYPTWFPGLTNSYYGWYNPSAMGGPGNKLIIWNGGGCRDTTILTVLESEAGPNDTFCPAAGAQVLKNFRPSAGYNWSGRGIADPTKPDYDPSFFYGLGKPSWRDTLTLRSGRCTDQKFVFLFPTRIVKKDTLFFCFEDPARILNNTLLGLSPNGGTWSGPGITGVNVFTANRAGYGHHQLVYTKNGCRDTLPVFVRPKPVVQPDTTVCIVSSPFRCYAAMTGGTFSGTGITNAALGTFSPTIAGRGSHLITYRNKFGCLATFRITVDTMPAVAFTTSVTDYCFKDSLFRLSVNMPGGSFSGPGVTGNTFRPSIAGSGAHKLSYTLNSGACKATAILDVTVSDTLKVRVTPGSDTVCPGEIVWLRASATGGDRTSYRYDWSHGQTGSGAFVTPQGSQTYTVRVTDGCSDPAAATVPILRHGRPWFTSQTSPPVCFGLKGWARVRMKDNDPYAYTWDVSPPVNSDSLNAPAGNQYRLTVLNRRTGCMSDTMIEIPGFQAISAGFIAKAPNGEPCLSNVYPTLRIFNNCIGAETGIWSWGDGSTEPFSPADNPRHTYSGDKDRYHIKLKVFNSGGCTDSADAWICYRDTVIYHIPNAFSPNGDLINDEFMVQANGIREFEMLIYNRWGQLVFRTNDISKGWNGTFQGKPCQEDVYAVWIKYKGRKTGWKQDKETLLLLRGR